MRVNERVADGGERVGAKLGIVEDLLGDLVFVGDEEFPEARALVAREPDGRGRDLEEEVALIVGTAIATD